MFYIYLFLIIFIPLIALIVEIILAKSNLKFFFKINILVSGVLSVIGGGGIVITTIMLNDMLSQAFNKLAGQNTAVLEGVKNNFYQYLLISLIIIVAIIFAFLIKLRLNKNKKNTTLAFIIIIVLFILNFLISFIYSTMVFTREFDIIFYIMLLAILESYLFHIPITYTYFLKLKASTIKIYAKKIK